MNNARPERFDAAVLWRKWRLMKGTELYDVAADPAQDRNVAKDHPDVVAKMRAHYETWWADVEPRVNEPSRLVIGSDAEPATLLSPADWFDVLLDQQLQVRTALAAKRPLAPRSRPRRAIRLRAPPLAARSRSSHCAAASPRSRGSTASSPRARPCPSRRRRLKVGDAEMTRPVGADDKFVRFSVPLKKGDLVGADLVLRRSRRGVVRGVLRLRLARRFVVAMNAHARERDRHGVAAPAAAGATTNGIGTGSATSRWRSTS